MRIPLLILLSIPLLSYGQTDSIASLVKERIDHTSENPVHSILLYLEKLDQGFIYNQGFGKRDKELPAVSENDRFRIASSTKLFVSTIILQLVEEAKLSLNDKASLFLKDIDYLDFEQIHLLDKKSLSDQITIKQLLSHRTGLADIFSDKGEEFFGLLLQDIKKQYSPKSIIELYYQYNLNQTPHFAPGNGWHYSDMNYVLLGLISEQIDQTTLAKSVRSRILDPLEMEDTYFEFYEDPSRQGNRINQYVGELNFTEMNTSFDWSGGGLVSTNKDLATFLKSLFSLSLINEKSLNRMIEVEFTKDQENRYGLGMYESKYDGETYFGHFGFYGTFVGFCPATKTVISYSVSQATPNFNVHNFVSEVLKLTE